MPPPYTEMEQRNELFGGQGEDIVIDPTAIPLEQQTNRQLVDTAVRTAKDSTALAQRALRVGATAHSGVFAYAHLHARQQGAIGSASGTVSTPRVSIGGSLQMDVHLQIARPHMALAAYQAPLSAAVAQRQLAPDGLPVLHRQLRYVTTIEKVPPDPTRFAGTLERQCMHLADLHT